MIRPMHFPNATDAWRVLAGHIADYGTPVSPREMETKEVAHATLSFDMSHPVLACRQRKLSYRFMAAEPLWYLSGSDKVEPIAKYNPRMREFSDNGQTLYGAYGPPIMNQMSYVVDVLLRDPSTRQAWLTIWRRNPAQSKDIPCTIGLGWRISMGALHCHAYMRSSDAYLGVPYDWFSFTMLSAYIACAFNRAHSLQQNKVQLGHMHWTAASSHIYKRDMDRVLHCLRHGTFQPGPRIDPCWIIGAGWDRIEQGLKSRRDMETPDAGSFDLKPKWKETPCTQSQSQPPNCSSC